MTQTSWPFENVDTTETQYSYLFDRLKTSGVAGFPTDTALKVTAPGGTMTVNTAAGFAIVRGFMYWSDAVVTNTISASSSNPRIDLIILRLDPVANSIVQAVKTGTPAASPSAPSLYQDATGTYEIEIGRVTVPALATSIASSNVKDTRNCLSQGVGIWTEDSRPNSANYPGRLGWSTTNQVLEVWTGSAWEEAAPNNIDASTITSGTIPTARLGTSFDVGDYLTVDPSYLIVGARAPQILTGYATANLGTTFSTKDSDQTLSGSSTYALTMTAHIVDAVSAATTATLRLWVGSSYFDYQCYIASGQTGVITVTRRVLTDPSTSIDVSHQLKVSTGSGIAAQVSLTVIGMN